jgi:aminoglycoside phosphotransferase (APT) family kinase protein
MELVEAHILGRLAHRLSPGSRLLRAWPLKGGISARMTVIEMQQPDGRERRLVIRQPGEATLQRNPGAAADEFKLLQILTGAGLPAPTPHYLDESGEILSTPYLVIQYIEGEPVLAPADLDDFVRQMAAELARVHTFRGPWADLSFLPEQSVKAARTFAARCARLDGCSDGEQVREILEPVWPLPQTDEPVLLHGDFWPGNVIWREGRVAAVIDWEAAKRGDPLSDIANARLDILWAFGVDAMQEFTAHYAAMTSADLATLPYGIYSPPCARSPTSRNGRPPIQTWGGRISRRRPCETGTAGSSPRRSRSYPLVRWPS